MNTELKAIIEQQRAQIAARRESAIEAAVARSLNENVAPKVQEIERNRVAEIAEVQRQAEAAIAEINATASAAKTTAAADDKAAVVISVGAEYDAILDKYNAMLADNE